MKYPKVLQILLAASVVTAAVPGAAVPTYASADESGDTLVEENGRETPGSYEGPTGRGLPEDYHYVLEDGEYVMLDGEDAAVIEADVEFTDDMEVEEAAGGDGESGENLNISENSEEVADGETGESGEAESSDAGGSEDKEDDGSGDSTDADDNDNAGETGDNSDGGTVNGDEINDDSADEDASGSTVNPGDDGNEEKTGIGDLPVVIRKENNHKEKAADSTPGEKLVTKPKASSDGKSASEQLKEAIKKQAETDVDFEASAKFLELGDRIRYNVEVPIEGLPSFITQEMIVGALKAQDETGYPASVTIAQIIQESGYGKYGPGGEEGEGLSYLAYQYCNLFGIKGTGTIGSAKLNTFEMTADGQTYYTKAGFRAYNTYTECIEDRSKLLAEVYSDLTEGVTDANTFAVRIGRRWATDINYSRSLIRTMEKYDLYRLDELTLTDFNSLIGRFADPCPGATVSSTYGYRSFDDSFHKGLDLGTGTENIPTYAADAGTVIFAGKAGTAGNMVMIDHGDGLITKYMHHYEVFVKTGQKVEKGQQIGISGTTGDSTGNHLHFQVEENGKAVNPMKYLSDEGTGMIVKMRDKTDGTIDRAFVKANKFNEDEIAESADTADMDTDQVTPRLKSHLFASR